MKCNKENKNSLKKTQKQKTKPGIGDPGIPPLQVA